MEPVSRNRRSAILGSHRLLIDACHIYSHALHKIDRCRWNGRLAFIRFPNGAMGSWRDRANESRLLSFCTGAPQMKRVLPVFMVLTWAFSYEPTAALAASTWTGIGGTSDFNTGSNWSAGIPTTGNAIFGSALPTDITLSANVSITTFTFNPGAAAYTFTVPNAVTLVFQGTAGSFAGPLYHEGIFNNSAQSQTLIVNKGGALNFTGDAIAGNAVIQNSGTLTDRKS